MHRHSCPCICIPAVLLNGCLSVPVQGTLFRLLHSTIYSPRSSGHAGLLLHFTGVVTWGSRLDASSSRSVDRLVWKSMSRSGNSISGPRRKYIVRRRRSFLFWYILYTLPESKGLDPAGAAHIVCRTKTRHNWASIFISCYTPAEGAFSVARLPLPDAAVALQSYCELRNGLQSEVEEHRTQNQSKLQL